MKFYFPGNVMCSVQTTTARLFYTRRNPQGIAGKVSLKSNRVSKASNSCKLFGSLKQKSWLEQSVCMTNLDVHSPH